ncbi:MAG: periplasmic heavy metal sensor [Alphaproteobacteria bacterium]|nr:periplasmic heavy metal sensor [Alphaproteobacteria bacterium]
MTNETTPTPTPPQTDEHGRKRRWRWTRRVLFGSGIAVALAGAGTYFTHAQPRHHFWGGHHHGGAFDAQSATEWAQLMTRQMLRRVDATADQQDRVQAIVAGALKDLMPMREEGRTAREAGVKLVTAPTIDRDALERLRAGQISMHEQASRRMMKAVLDIAEVLTPEQRDKLAQAMAEHRWGWRR